MRSREFIVKDDSCCGSGELRFFTGQFQHTLYYDLLPAFIAKTTRIGRERGREKDREITVAME